MPSKDNDEECMIPSKNHDIEIITIDKEDKVIYAFSITSFKVSNWVENSNES